MISVNLFAALLGLVVGTILSAGLLGLRHGARMRAQLRRATDVWIDPAGTYSMSGAPPAGRKVRDGRGQIWRVTATTSQAAPYGSWWPTLVLIGHEDGEGMPATPLSRWWPDLLSIGPVTLVPLTAEEEQEERLYGPIGARWGDPAQPCHYPDCMLGLGHVGAHLDDQDQPLGRITGPITEEDPGPNLITCTCDQASTGHAPSCPRWIGSTAPRSIGPNEGHWTAG